MPGVPIYVYHDFAPDEAARACASPAHRPYVLTRSHFAEHLEALASAGGRSCSLRDACTAAPGAFVLTFDDGAMSDYELAFPMLQERGWSGCFFVIAGDVGQAGSVGWPELRAMADAGMEIGSHSLTHPHMQRLAATEIEREFRESKRVLEDGLGRAVTVASLPRGSAPRGIGTLLAGCGYEIFCTSAPGLCGARSDRFRLPRIAVKHGTSTALIRRVLEGRATTMARLRTLYLAKAAGKQLVGAERWRRLRGAVMAAEPKHMTRGA